MRFSLRVHRLIVAPPVGYYSESDRFYQAFLSWVPQPTINKEVVSIQGVRVITPLFGLHERHLIIDVLQGSHLTPAKHHTTGEDRTLSEIDRGSDSYPASVVKVYYISGEMSSLFLYHVLRRLHPAS